MNCPFLRETTAHSCRSASFGRLIPNSAMAGEAADRCRTSAFCECPLFRESDAEAEDGPPCPLYRDTLVQYCAASPVTKYIPWSEASIARCGTDAYRYCRLYLDLAQTVRHDAASDLLHPPASLRITSNHMWIDLPEEGLCHIGIDAFLARMLGPVDHIRYLSPRGLERPSALLGFHDMELPVVFPEALEITACNLYLRSTPGRLTEDPYAHGWLFEGTLPEAGHRRLSEWTVASEKATPWMEQELCRVNQRIQDADPAFAADGGLFAQGLLALLPPTEAFRFFFEFCSPRGGRTDWGIA